MQQWAKLTVALRLFWQSATSCGKSYHSKKSADSRLISNDQSGPPISCKSTKFSLQMVRSQVFTPLLTGSSYRVPTSCLALMHFSLIEGDTIFHLSLHLGSTRESVEMCDIHFKHQIYSCQRFVREIERGIHMHTLYKQLYRVSQKSCINAH